MSYIGRFAAGSGADPIETLTGNSGGPVPPTGFNINVVGTGVITVIGNPATSTLTITPDGSIASSFPTDAGTATPALGVLNVFGGTGINTSGAGNTVTINADATVPLSFPTDAGTAIPAANALSIVGAGGITTTGVGNTVTVDGSGISTNITLTGDTGGPLVSNSFTFTSNPSAGYSTSFSGAVTTLTLNLTNSFNNTFLGKNCGNTTGGGGDNIGIGVQALQNQTVCSSNIAIGDFALNALTQGSTNIAVGVNCLSFLSQGGSNIAIGDSAGTTYNTTESTNIVIASYGIIGDNNTLRIGAAGGSTGNSLSASYIDGIDGVNVGSTAKVVTMGTAGTVDQLGTAVITAGTGITVTPGANTITISGSGGGLTWSVITLDQTAAVNNGYFCNKAGTLALALPAASAVGDVIEVTNENTALGVQFTQAAGQQILIGNTNTTLGAAGTLTSSAVGDTLKIVCKVANTIWRVSSMVGNWSPV